MVPLGLCSLAALTIIIERAFALRRSRVISVGIIDVMDVYQGKESVAPALDACDRSNSALANMCEDLINARNVDHVHLIETVHTAGRREVVKLERGLVVLEIVAGISPLIGLLGTVLGMVTVFDAISTQGIGNPQVLSEGISKALVTTVAGLIVAIPALAFHSYLSRHVESLAVELQDLATGFAAKLRILHRVDAGDDVDDVRSLWKIPRRE